VRFEVSPGINIAGVKLHFATTANHKLISSARKLNKMVPELLFPPKLAPATTAEDGGRMWL
jgi:hypothetical protein